MMTISHQEKNKCGVYLIDRQFELNNKNIVISVSRHTLLHLVSFTSCEEKTEKAEVIVKKWYLYFHAWSLQKFEKKQTTMNTIIFSYRKYVQWLQKFEKRVKRNLNGQFFEYWFLLKTCFVLEKNNAHYRLNAYVVEYLIIMYRVSYDICLLSYRKYLEDFSGSPSELVHTIFL